MVFVRIGELQPLARGTQTGKFDSQIFVASVARESRNFFRPTHANVVATRAGIAGFEVARVEWLSVLARSAHLSPAALHGFGVLDDDLRESADQFARLLRILLEVTHNLGGIESDESGSFMIMK